MVTKEESEFLRAIHYMLKSNWHVGKACRIEFHKEGEVYMRLIYSITRMHRTREQEGKWEHKCSPKFVKEFKKWLNVPKSFYHQIRVVEFELGRNIDMKQMFRDEFKNHIEKKMIELL